MESASDRRRSLARERLQRCHLADLKLFFPLAFSHSQSPAYVHTALLAAMQIFVGFLLLLFLLYLVTGFSQPTIRVCPFCFCLHVSSILHCILIVARGFPAHAYTYN